MPEGLQMNRKAFKYRLYPTRSQEKKLQEALDVCRGLYNSFLHDRKFSYEVDGKAPTEREQEKKIAQWKAAHPARKLVNRFGLIAVEALDVSNMSASPAPKQDEILCAEAQDLGCPKGFLKTGQFLPNGHAAKAGLNKSILDAGRGSPFGHSKSFTSA